jgi:hypothetical protein
LKWLSPNYTDATFFAIQNGTLYSAWLITECVIGLALLLKLFGGLEVIVGGLVFATFTAINLWNGWTGVHTCSCLGALRVNPWAMAVVDTTITAGLFTLVTVDRPSFRIRRVLVVVTVTLLFVLVAAVHATGLRGTLVSLLTQSQVYFEPQPLDLGEHPVGTTIDFTANLHNNTPHPVRVTGLAGDGPIAGGPGFCRTLPPGNFGGLPLQFTTNGAPGRRMASTIIYCEVDSGTRPTLLTITWVNGQGSNPPPVRKP